MFSTRLVWVLRAAAAMAAAMSLPLPVNATAITSIDEFVITRSGVPSNTLLGAYEGQDIFYQDSFSDGVEPSSGGSFFNGNPGIYNVLGSYPSDAESGGKLQLDSSFGGLFINANGFARTDQRSTLLTDFDPNDQAGLKQSFHTFSAYGRFDLAIPPLPVDGYGIFLNDGGPLGATEALNLFVRREPNNSLVVRFQHQDFMNGGIDPLQLDDLLFPVDADQIELRLQRGDVNTDTVTAAYRFWDNGLPMSMTFTDMTSAEFFTTNGWARAGFFAVQAIPEPETYALMLAGLGLLGLAARRRKQQAG